MGRYKTDSKLLKKFKLATSNDKVLKLVPIGVKYSVW